MAAPDDPTPAPDRLVRFRDLLADLDLFAPGLWSGAPSYALTAPLSPEELAAAEDRLGPVCRRSTGSSCSSWVAPVPAPTTGWPAQRSGRWTTSCRR